VPLALPGLAGAASRASTSARDHAETASPARGIIALFAARAIESPRTSRKPAKLLTTHRVNNPLPLGARAPTSDLRARPSCERAGDLDTVGNCPPAPARRDLGSPAERERFPTHGGFAMTARQHVLDPTARPADEFTNRSGEVVRVEQVGWSPDRPSALRIARRTIVGGVFRIDVSPRYALRLLRLVLDWAQGVDPTGVRTILERFLSSDAGER
jgi:hypothetical protein